MSEVVALTHATLIDGTGEPPVADATVVMADGVISATGSADRVAIPAGADVVDCSGAFVIPV